MHLTSPKRSPARGHNVAVSDRELLARPYGLSTVTGQQAIGSSRAFRHASGAAIRKLGGWLLRHADHQSTYCQVQSLPW